MRLYRAGELRPYRGRFFACATRKGAQRWARHLGRDTIVEIEVDGETPCVVNTHGYVEADWYSVLDPKPWSAPSEEQIRKCLVFRQNMTIAEAVEILSLLDSEEEYQAHEIVWA